jgi:hypothetical protein
MLLPPPKKCRDSCSQMAMSRRKVFFATLISLSCRERSVYVPAFCLGCKWRVFQAQIDAELTVAGRLLYLRINNNIENHRV